MINMKDEKYVFQKSEMLPGGYYFELKTSAYLPDTLEGRKVLMLLKAAFDQHLTFTLRHFQSTNQLFLDFDNIEHKLNKSGGQEE